MTDRELILWILGTSSFTCAEICKQIIFYNYENERSKKQLNASISGELKKMIDYDILEYNSELKGPKNGYVYKIKHQNEKAKS